MGYTAIIDYDVGNLMSVSNAMHYLGFETKVTADRRSWNGQRASFCPVSARFRMRRKSWREAA